MRADCSVSASPSSVRIQVAPPLYFRAWGGIVMTSLKPFDCTSWRGYGGEPRPSAVGKWPGSHRGNRALGQEINPATRISRSGSLGRVPFAAASDALPLSFLPGDVEPGPHAAGITIPVRVFV